MRRFPISIRTGKALEKKHTEVRLVYKPSTNDSQKVTRFIFYIEEKNEVYSDFVCEQELNAEGELPELDPKSFQKIPEETILSGYAKLIFDGMEDRWFNFPQPNVIAAVWDAVSEVINSFETEVTGDLKRDPARRKILLLYPAGSTGPKIKE